MASSTERKKNLLSFLSICCVFTLGIGATALRPKPVLGAEKIVISYGVFEFSLPVNSLEKFAKTGEVDRDLSFYARFLKEDGLANFRKFLQRRFDVTPVVMSQLTYAPIGVDVLQKLGNVIRTGSRLDGFHALRAALILSAADPEGMTIVNIMRKFPTSEIYMDARQLLELQAQFTTLFDYQKAAVAAVSQATEQEAQSSPNIPSLGNLTKPGRFRFYHRTLQLTRNRQPLVGTNSQHSFRVELYIPEGLSQRAPVVVISHGLGSDPKGFAYLGQHLASHGFVAVLPQHIGSDAAKREAFLLGIGSSSTDPMEFVDRPLDIKYTLDQLERLSQGELAGKMNLQQVGVIGHSYGGYTALALAGAKFNQARIAQACSNRKVSLNASIFLQCLATDLPPVTENFRDPRIKAVIALNPLTSIVFGPEGMSNIQIPTMILGGSADIITSVVQEQIQPFIWMKNPEKYLSVVIPSGHAAADQFDGTDNQPAPNTLGFLLSGRDPKLARDYIKGLSLAFMQAYLNDRSEYKDIINAAYAQSVSREPLKLDLIRSLTPEQLEQSFGGKPPIPIIPKPVTTDRR
ncbi:alpha/beta hydrolase [Phormidium sp. LEGE 05292]|uniref:alpha/beta hydrolase n=1 Tax=[Phormidium] sp. LEGE 05292 TaxID=767427 RepID=UPI0018830886|nr:alpha/beta hydrolase [Phormidium sp. LEGE 05292]MBE9224953.1 alpha/beta hydrolase [Phormidium sp. LEGE 05292]